MSVVLKIQISKENAILIAHFYSSSSWWEMCLPNAGLADICLLCGHEDPSTCGIRAHCALEHRQLGVHIWNALVWGFLTKPITKGRFHFEDENGNPI